LAVLERSLSLALLVADPPAPEAAGLGRSGRHRGKEGTPMKTWIIRYLVVVSLAAALAACGTTTAAPAGGSNPPVDEAQATAIARNALEGYTSGDYAVWARDWSDLMTGAIKEADFLAFREQFLSRTGAFVAIESVTYAETKPGVHRYTFTVRFEKLTADVWFSWFDGSPKVEGVQF
jgi:hypothetical protein